jgi:phage terminase large subunit GpA-like protein
MPNLQLLRAASKAIAPPQRLLPSEWANTRFRLSQEDSAEPGQFSTDRAPFQKGVFDAIADPDTREVVVMSCAQVLKTTMLKVFFGYFVEIDPSPILWVCPSLQEAERTSKTRLAPMIRDCPTLTPLFSSKTRDGNNSLLLKLFPGGLLVMSGSNSPSSLSSYPIRVLLMDEIDRYDGDAGGEGDPVTMAKKRTNTFSWNKVLVYVSTPAIKDSSRIEKLYAISDKRKYYVPCPHCGFEQDLIWENLRYPCKGEIDITQGVAGIEDIFYFCGNCGAGIEENQKIGMLQAGEWRATSKSAGIAGFHINELYSPWKSWEDVALDYESAKGDQLQLQVFVNTSLGMPFEPDSRTRYDWENLLIRAESSDYSLGQVPEGVLLLTAGVDCQGDRLEAVIMGWGEDGQSWVIDYQKLYGEPLQDWVWGELESFLQKQYRHPLGGSLKVKKTVVDSGFSTHDVYGQVLKRPSWLAAKGVSGDRPIISKPRLVEVNWRGQVIKKGINLYSIGVDVGKATLLSRCRIDRPGKNYFNLPQDIGKDYCQGFAGSEVQVKKHKGGQVYYCWEPVVGTRNEPLDCTVYAFAAATLSGLRRNWEQVRNALTVSNPRSEPYNPSSEVNDPSSASYDPSSEANDPSPRIRQRRSRHSGYLNGFGSR